MATIPHDAAQRDFSPSPMHTPERVAGTRSWQRALGPLDGVESRANERNRASQDPTVRALGWFSVGLGAAQLLTPRTVARAAGIEWSPGLVRACGVREMATGAGLLSDPQPSRWMWARLAGDALDIAMLAAAFAGGRSDRGRVAFAMSAVAAVTALDVATAKRLDRPRGSRTGEVRSDGSVRVEHSLTVHRSPEECYRAWRDFERLPRFMSHLESVRVDSPTHSHWTAKAPAGTRVEWDAEIVHDRPNESIAWRSVGDDDIRNAGAVTFAPSSGRSGTVVTVAMQYTPPLGAVGRMAAKLFGEEPEQQIREDLRRFKRILETGEIPTTEGQPSGQRSALFKLLGKANPS